MRGGARTAWVCDKCIPVRRTFAPTQPKCETHGPMKRQANKAYRGKSTK